MKFLGVVLLAAALSGCASTKEVLDSAPKEIVKSPKPVAEVSFCLANKNNVAVLRAPDGAEVIQVKNLYRAVGMIFSVYPDGDGSRIEIRKPIGASIAAHRSCY